MGLSTHILDTALGRPAVGIPLALSRRIGDAWQEVGDGITDSDGRCRTLLGDRPLATAVYRLRFEVDAYFVAQGVRSLYPLVDIVFQVHNPEEHHHIPLLLAANGFTTYRGS